MKPLHNYWECFKVLPALYDESLSYYEVLAKLTYSINEIIKQIDKDNQDLINYIDSQNEIIYIRSKSYTDEQINKISESFNNSIVILTKYVQTSNEQTRAYVVGQIEILKQWIEKQAVTGLVINPITGNLDNIQNVLNMYYNVFNYYALSCIEYDTLGLTCDIYDNKNLTCIMYDYQGKKYLWFDNDLYMFHPETGERTFYKNIIDFLTELHRTDCVTCTDYDNLNLSTDNYNSKNINCYDYDWNSKTLF